MAYKTFVNGFPLNASEINNNLMNQVISTFATEAARTSAISAPVEGQITYLESTQKFYKFDSSAWVELPGFDSQVSQAISPNYIINGAFDVWQYGTSTSVQNGFAADRWKLNLSGATASLTQQSFTPADVTATGFGEGQYYARLQATVADDNVSILQNVEDVRTLAGQTVTVSAWLRSSDATGLAFELQQYFGTGGSSATPIGTSIKAVTSNWARYEATFDFPSISGKTIGTNSSVKLFITNKSNETFTADIWGVQLEAGSVATPFKRHAPTLQGELAACQRYFQVRGGQSAYERVGAGVFYSTTQFRAVAQNFVEMRATPTLIPSPTGNWRVESNGTYAISAFSLDSATPRVTSINCAVTGATAGYGGQLTASADSTARLSFSAEL